MRSCSGATRFDELDVDLNFTLVLTDPANMNLQTTVVFTDLIGSTGVFESVGNLRATEAVTRLTQWISGVCAEHGGQVVKTLGDGVLALFPSGQMAVDAVVQMQRQHQANIAQTPLELRMPIRIGVASGDVEMVGGDCFGDAVNVAARLSDLSGPHEIWANDLSLAKAVAHDGVRFRSLGSVQIRGRTELCAAYQLEWQTDLNTAFLTRQADLDTHLDGIDVLGGQIELSWNQQSRSFRSFDLPVQMGRVAGLDVTLNDPRVSRTHARLDWRNGSIVLVDISSYGSWVRFSGGGSDVLLRRKECVLHGDGLISLGAPPGDSDEHIIRFKVS
ncbi:MAG: hypothetical protein RJA34_1426 [Pseudomonadota bacterium]|jgi:class 3 adenylate cyclase